MASFKDRLTELLVSQKILTKEKLQEALAIHNRKSLPLREVLLKEGFIDEAKLVSVLSESLYIPTLNLANYRVDRSVAEIVPERLARAVLPGPYFSYRRNPDCGGFRPFKHLRH